MSECKKCAEEAEATAVYENMKRCSEEISTWSREKLENTLLQFSEHQRKRAEYQKEKDEYMKRYLAPSEDE